MAAVAIFHFSAPAIESVAAGLPVRLVVITLNFASLTYPFMLGTLAYVWRDQLRLSGWVALLLWVPVAIMPAGLPMQSAIVLALVYGSLWFGFVPKGPLLAYNRLGDYSYGIYIYAFPVQQLLVHLMPGMTPLQNIAFAFPLSLVLAVLSWTLVEERALASVRPLAERLTAGRRQQVA